MKALTKRERLEREAAWNAERERVRRLGELFNALPDNPQKLALIDAMTDRIVALYNDARYEHGDILLEFLPNRYAHDILDWYFDDESRTLPCPTYSSAKEHETSEQGEVSGQPPESGGADGLNSEQTNIRQLTALREGRG